MFIIKSLGFLVVRNKYVFSTAIHALVVGFVTSCFYIERQIQDVPGRQTMVSIEHEPIIGMWVAPVGDQGAKPPEAEIL